MSSRFEGILSGAPGRPITFDELSPNGYPTHRVYFTNNLAESLEKFDLDRRFDVAGLRFNQRNWW